MMNLKIISKFDSKFDVPISIRTFKYLYLTSTERLSALYQREPIVEAEEHQDTTHFLRLLLRRDIAR